MCHDKSGMWQQLAVNITSCHRPCIEARAVETCAAAAIAFPLVLVEGQFSSLLSKRQKQCVGFAGSAAAAHQEQHH